MPIYEFKCKECETKFELLCSMHGADGASCPDCGSGDVSRLFSTFFSRGTSSDGHSHSSSCAGCSSGKCSSCGCGHH